MYFYCNEKVNVKSHLINYSNNNTKSCNNSKKQLQAPTLTAKEVVQLNTSIYKRNIVKELDSIMPQYKIVYLPKEVNGNFAIIAQKINTAQYCLIIRGSVMELNESGFQNFILQDFNIFNLKPWNYTDTVKGAFIGDGRYLVLKICCNYKILQHKWV